LLVGVAALKHQQGRRAKYFFLLFIYKHTSFGGLHFVTNY
jgi:hypothetical protein